MNGVPTEFLVLSIVLLCGVALIIIIVRSPPAGSKNTGADPKVTDLLNELVAGLIAVDGKIATREVDAAIQIGTDLMPDFDETALKAFCYGNKTPRNHKLIAREFSTRIDQDQKQRIVKYLIAITTADKEIRTSEAELIDEICAIWDVRMNG